MADVLIVTHIAVEILILVFVLVKILHGSERILTQSPCKDTRTDKSSRILKSAMQKLLYDSNAGITHTAFLHSYSVLPVFITWCHIF